MGREQKRKQNKNYRHKVKEDGEEKLFTKGTFLGTSFLILNFKKLNLPLLLFPTV